MANAWFPRRTPHYAVHQLFAAFILVRIPLYYYTCIWYTEAIPLLPGADTIDEDGWCCIYGTDDLRHMPFSSQRTDDA
jgi:hypothetical protein